MSENARTGSPNRAAIYARFSTELQNDRSIEDQVALCRAFAAREQLEVVEVYGDRARSGASIFGRDGLIKLIDAARDGVFDIVILEALDRPSRDQEDLAGIWKRLKFLGIEIRAVHDGRADIVQIGVRGLVGALYLQDLAHKVRRGMAGVVRSGRHAGGRAYGYRPVSDRAGELQIIEEEAAIIRRIFADYVAGVAPRAIAHALNQEGIAAPRGRRWNASTINGNAQRGAGILQNELYAGRIVWNKVRMIKDPDTGKRVSRPNPPDEWQSIDAPHLALIDRDTFAAAQARKSLYTKRQMNECKRPRHLLSGLLRCGVCGAGMSVHDRDKTGKTRVRCSTVRESGSCWHARVYYLEAIERIAVNGLRDALREPKLIAEYVKTYENERRRLASEMNAKRAKLEARYGEIRRALNRLVDALADGIATASSIKDRLLELESEKSRVEAEIAETQPELDTVALHPTAMARYLEQIENLSEALKSGGLNQGSAAAAFRALVASVIVHPVEPRTPLDIEIQGETSPS